MHHIFRLHRSPGCLAFQQSFYGRIAGTARNRRQPELGLFSRAERGQGMANHLADGFHRRRNEDGTFDSICLLCFRTAASAPEESELSSLELKHVCDPAWRWFIRDTSNYDYVAKTQPWKKALRKALHLFHEACRGVIERTPEASTSHHQQRRNNSQDNVTDPLRRS